MAMRRITLNKNRRGICAFCKHWYDVGNTHIKPYNTRSNVWEYDDSVKCKCMISNYDKHSYAVCTKYECKIDIN